MKIVLGHRFFWPDAAPYGLILRSMAETLADAGHDVTVVTSQPGYRSTERRPKREDTDGVRVIRMAVLPEIRLRPVARAVNALRYALFLFFHIVWIRPDLAMASTFPPVIAGASARIGARLTGARFVYHMQDIHPEVSLLGRPGGRPGLALRLLRAIDNRTLSRADAVIVLSEDMADTVRARGVPIDRLEIVENPMLAVPGAHSGSPSELAKPADVFRIIFAGNLGRFQNLERLVEGVMAAAEVDPAIELLLLGDGAAAAGLKARWQGHPQVRFWPFLPFEQAREVIAAADLGLVSLSPEVFRVSSPSKLATYLGLGLPALVLVEPESRLARMVEENGLGAVPASDTVADISTTIAQLRKTGPSRSHVRHWFGTHLADEVVMGKWIALAASLEGER